MAQGTKDEAYSAILVYEETEGDKLIMEQVLDDIWFTMGLDHYPPGVDYYLLDCGATAGYATAERWLGILLNVPSGTDKFWIEATKRLRLYPDLAPIFDGLEMFRRRRARAEPGWDDDRSRRVNRLIRAKSRAIKMLGRSAAEVAA